ncbi:glycoside hydrolase family 18 protein [Nonomuraea glycinis]|uniref:hypothetical protein n=1 Tax=Nonomuraea glycinis TaxID=2047744 RepID=UPI002E157032|nr:hypothetical protein OHA68_43040 [Nonomuraea glycinis]
MLPRPFAVLFALALAGATALAISLLPARATLQLTVPRPAPSSAGPAPAALLGRSTYVRFVDTAAEPGFDLPADARRSGVRWYALGHLVAGPDGCTSRWAGRLDFGHDPVAKRIGGLRAVGADAGLVFGGPDGGEPAATCTRPGALAAAYRRVVGAFDADYVDFDLRTDSEDHAATAVRRARAIRAMQQERRLRVSFTLPLRPYGIATRDLDTLRLTRKAGADIGAVNLLADIEPHAAAEGRMQRVALALHAARTQLARAHDLADPEHAWRRLALTCVLKDPDDLSETDARKLTAFADRYGLAWLSERGADPKPGVEGILRRTSTRTIGFPE